VSALIQSINQDMVSAEVQSALRVLAMARSHLTNAQNIAPFSGDTDQTKRIGIALDDVNHAIDQLNPKSLVIES
jgi:hypothetical protein